MIRRLGLVLVLDRRTRTEVALYSEGAHRVVLTPDGRFAILTSPATVRVIE